MFEIKKNKKNKSAVILNPERSEWVSRSHVTSVEPVVNDRVKTKRYSAKRDLYGHSLRSTLKMTAFAFLLSLNISESRADTCTCEWSGADNKTLTITNCSNGGLGSSACSKQKTANNVVVGTGVTSIGDQAFYDDSSLTSITIPEGVTTIGAAAFARASSLTSITIPDSVTIIAGSAFSGAIGLTSITIPEGVTSIGDSTFNGARSLTSITIPDSVTSIGDYAFTDAKSLNNIICKGDEASCAAMVNALPSRLWNKVSYPTDKTSCEGASTSLYVWDSENRKCGRRNEEQCNSVAKYYYNSSANNGAGQCQLLPKTQSACTGANIEWNATDNRCVNKNYTPSQEANNSDTGGDDTGGDDIGDVSGDFNPADCYNKGQVPYENKCWNEYPFAKKRWTPAEASKWLHDGNDNFVVITFKK